MLYLLRVDLPLLSSLVNKFIKVFHLWLSLSYLDKLIHILSFHRESRPVLSLIIVSCLLNLVDPIFTCPLSSVARSTLVLNILVAINLFFLSH